MIPSSDCRFRLVNKFAIFSALLLIGASNSVHARNLRRIRSSSSIIDNVGNEESRIDNRPIYEPHSFEVVGAPMEHDPFIPQDTTYRATMQREIVEVSDEEDESLVSFVRRLLAC